MIDTNFCSASFKNLQTTIRNFILIFGITLAAIFISGDTKADQIQTYTVADGLVGPIVPVIFQDSRGVLWFGSDRGGVSQFYDNTFRPYVGSQDGYEGVEAGALLGQTKQIVEDKWGHIWFLSRNYSEKSGRISRFDGSEISFIGMGNSLIADQYGDIWVGENQVLTKYVTPGVQKLPQAQPHELIGEDLIRATGLTISVIFESTDGTLWLGGSEGEEEQTGVILSFRENPWIRAELGGDDGGDEIDDGTPRIHPNAGFTRFNISDLNVVNPIETIAEDAAGNLWFGGSNLLLRFDGKDFEQISPAWTFGGPRASRTSRVNPVGKSVSIQIDTKERLWFSDGRSTRQWDGSRLRRIRGATGFLEIEDKWGNLWFISGGHGIEQYDSELNPTSHNNTNSRLGNDEIRTIFEAVDGKLWFGHNNGVTVFEPTPAVITHAGLGTSRIRTMYEDSRGYLWFSISGGVARYDTETGEITTASLRLGTVNRDGRRQQSEIVEIFEVGRDIWFINEPGSRGGSTRYTFFRYANGNYGHQISISIRTNIGPGGERSDSNTDVLVAEGEHVWMAFGGHLFKADATGLLWLTGSGSQRILFEKTTERQAETSVFEIEPGTAAITDLYRDSSDRLWVHFENGKVKRYPKSIDLVASTTRAVKPDELDLKATKLLKTVSERKWFFNGVTGKLIYWNNIETGRPIVLGGEPTAAPLAVWQHPTRANDEITFLFSDVLKTYHGTRLDAVQDINKLAPINASVTSQDGSLLWLATSRGAVRYDGTTLTTYTTKEDGFLVDNVRDVIEDSSGNIWFATRGGGTVRYDGETFHNRTTKNGWAHNNISKILESSDKDIWFATEAGVTQYTPARGGLPECRITDLEADKSYTDFSSTLVLPARGTKIFNVRGISSLREGLSYEFKLIGLDTPAWTELSAEAFSLLSTGAGVLSDGWTPPVTAGLANQQILGSNVTQSFQNQKGTLRIRYTGLKAGNYSFLIKAFRKDFPYTEPPAVVDFNIPPPFWTRWRTYLPTLIFITVVFTLIGRLVVNRRHTLQLRSEVRQREEAEMHRIRAELSEAQNIQMGLLPTEAPDTKGFDLAGMSVPATQVGGDFFDYLTVSNGHTAIAVADAAGKGLRGAMNAVLTNGMLYEVSRFKSEAAVILSDLNTGLAPRMYGPSFIALNLAVLDEAEKRVNYANGGQPYPILKRGTDIIEIESGDLPLGSMKKVEYESTTFDLAEGDILIFHTDGLIEALNTEEEMYGTDRLKESVSRIPDNFGAEATVQHIVNDVRDFVGEAEQYDDLTIVVIKRGSSVTSNQ